MNNSRSKRIKSILIGQSLVTIIIFLIASGLVIYSMGYKINLSARKIIKTGMIVISADVKPDRILLNNKEMPLKKDNAFTLEPGHYSLEIFKDGYHDWSANSIVEEELVNYFNNIILFKKNSPLVKLEDQSKIDKFSTPSNDLVENAPKGLSFNDYEIWLDDILLTRFSEKIGSVSWMPGYHHICYQKADALWAIEITGTNNTTLVNLPSSETARYYFGNRGKDLFLSQSGEYFKVEIR